MKSRLFLSVLISLVLSSVLSAQNKPEVSYTKSTFPKIFAAILQEAKKKWPNDYEMQVYTIENQCKALSEFIDLILSPEMQKAEMTRIWSQAIVEWSKGTANKNCNKGLEPNEGLDCYFS